MTLLRIAKEIFRAVAGVDTPWRLCPRCRRIWHASTPGHVCAELPEDCDGVVRDEECVECEERTKEL